jgi:outer membrane protein TolC
MQALGPGLGASIAAKRLLGDRSADDGEAQSRQSQLADAQVEVEQNAGREIREAAWNVETRLREIAVAKERLEIWRQRVADLEQKRETDGVTAFDVSAARLELLRADGDEVHRVIAWKVAQVKLKQAQGLLAAECGYGPPGCCR